MEIRRLAHEIATEIRYIRCGGGISVGPEVQLRALQDRLESIARGSPDSPQDWLALNPVSSTQEHDHADPSS